MKTMTLKMTPCLLIAGLTILLATPAFAGLTSLTDQEMKGITGQAGIGILLDEGMTDEQRREEQKKNSQIQAMMALRGVVPSELIRDTQNIRMTVNDSTRIVREFNTMQEGLLAVPMAVTTIISLPPAGLTGGGGFFF